MLLRCLECFASNAYSCFSKAALTAMAIIKVLLTVGIIVIVAVKLEDVRVELQIPGSLTDLTTAAGLANLTASLLAASASSPTAALPPPPDGGSAALPASSPASIPADQDLNTMAGPFHVNASCLLQKRGLNGQFNNLYNRTMCSYVYTVCGISLVATFAMACLLWCTCHLCGWGPILELSFALLGAAWWLAAALVLQENTAVAVNARPVAWQLILGNAASPPPADLAALLPPPPPSPPRAPLGHDAASQLAGLLEEYTPKSLRQWRQALVGMSWTMMGMFTACGVLLLVEACGCVLDCCSCLCRCCCCPDRPESRWRANLRNKRKRVGGEEYMEMRGGIAPSASISSGGSGSAGGAPTVMVVARSDDYSVASSPSKPSRRGWW